MNYTYKMHACWQVWGGTVGAEYWLSEEEWQEFLDLSVEYFNQLQEGLILSNVLFYIGAAIYDLIEGGYGVTVD